MTAPQLVIDSNQLKIISPTKFHRIFGKELAVALEVIFDLSGGTNKNKVVPLIESFQFPELVKCFDDVVRVYHPAIGEGDVNHPDGLTIKFVPWVDVSGVSNYRLLFRQLPKSKSRKSEKRWMKAGRFDEEKTFGFPDAGFIGLDFVSVREEFTPVFFKLLADDGSFFYVVISAKMEEGEAVLSAHRVNESEVPPHLQTALPDFSNCH